MSLRIRKDGRILCAALNRMARGDIYIDDAIHGLLASDKKLIVTRPEPEHSATGGEWWWKGEEPKDVIIDPYWYE